MLALLFVASAQAAEPIVRDAYGVPHIKAATVDQAFYYAGYAVAQDRLWQMENSRRLARGRMAEVFGKQYAASDREVLSTGYTEDELQRQIQSLSPMARAAIESYAKGVTAWIDEASKSGSLPSGYAENGFKPEPWTQTDCAAIAVRLFQQFGKGGAGEIRNMALATYLQGRNETKGRVFDVLDDFAWQNDPTSPTTIVAADDPLSKSHPQFPAVTREITVKHWDALPKVGLLELMPAIRLALKEESNRVAELVNTPFKVGSYCMVVGPGRSASRSPLLLSGPQMGFRTPSIIHEMSIDAPGLSVAGMDVPGTPGVVIGYTPDVAWGLTSGVADTDDIFYYKTSGEAGYIDGVQPKAFERVTQTLRVKGEPDQAVTQLRTSAGPVILNSKGAGVAFARRSSYWMKELQSLDAVAGMYSAKTPDDVDKALAHATMSFNFFYAMPRGEIGYRYVGLVPMRAAGLDPRFPTPAGPATDWRGMVPFDQMPHVRNPKSGLIVNWNNKPVAWWPNFDTPVWGHIFRNSAILAELDKPALSAQDLEIAAWVIARTDETWPAMKPFVAEAFQGVVMGREPLWWSTHLDAFDGRLIDGSISAQTYGAFINALRDELFLPTTGNFLSADTFRIAAQPSVIWSALSGKTKVNYLGARKRVEIVRTALGKAAEAVRATNRAGYAAPGIGVPGQPPIPYSNRGSYIQIIELGPEVRGRNIVTPGVAESGPHALDQVPLARAWLYKRMSTRPAGGG